MFGLNLLIAALSFSVALAAPAPVPAEPETPTADADGVPAIIAAEQLQQPITPVVPLRWLTHFADHFPAGTSLDLEWEGGDGMGCELYYVPHWPGFAEYEFVTIVGNTTENSYKWAVPNLDEYPEGTDFILGVKNGEGVGANWYDLTPSLPLR